MDLFDWTTVIFTNKNTVGILVPTYVKFLFAIYDGVKPITPAEEWAMGYTVF